jgi:hypothetical protein
MSLSFASKSRLARMPVPVEAEDFEHAPSRIRGLSHRYRHGLGAIEETLGCLREPAVGCPTSPRLGVSFMRRSPTRARTVPRCW